MKRLVINAVSGEKTLVDMTPSEVADLPKASPPPVPQELSFAQLLIGLVAEGWITEAEGDAWTNRQLPAAVNALISGLPQAERFAARARAKLPSVVLRNDALVVALATQQGKTAEQLDDFFRTYANV